MTFRWHHVVLAGTALSAVAAFWTARAGDGPALPERLIPHRPAAVQSDGYLSSKACKTCHPAQYETWQRSFHRTMTQIAAPDTVQADFDHRQVDDVPGTPMRLERRGAEFWAEFDDPDWNGSADRTPRITRQIVMITGSHQQQVYWYGTGRNRLMGQLPGMYLTADRRWVPRQSAFLRPPAGRQPSETGRWNVVCIDCHATHGKAGVESPAASRPDAGASADTTAAEFGIACEACHGPGQRHVRANRNPLRRYLLHLTGSGDSTTVQPARLDPTLSSQVCGQCHGIWTFHDPSDKQHANAAGLPYRPGDDLAKSRFVAQPSKNLGSATMTKVLADYPAFVADSFWPDGMVRVSGREYNGLIDSPCFKDATDPARTLSCFSCHAMHGTASDAGTIVKWADTHQVAVGKEGKGACVTCHAVIDANVPAHTNHRAGSSGSECYNCHMPYTSYGLLRALRSHQISSPTVTASVETGRPNACNACHLDKPLAWTAGVLERWYGTPQPSLNDDERTIAASLLWLLRGDAGQRALMAWSMGWAPAQEASGASWMAPYLSLLLDDPYDSVRYMAYRSLGSLPGFAAFNYNFLAPSGRRTADGVAAMNLWRRLPRSSERTDRALLFDARGSLVKDEWTRLVRQRDDRRVSLNE